MDSINRIDILESKKKEQEERIKKDNDKINDFVKYGKNIAGTPEGKQFFKLARELFIAPLELEIALNNDANLFLLGKMHGEYKALKNVIVPFINNERSD